MTCETGFDLFGEGAGPSVATPLLPRASSHRSFASCKDLWPIKPTSGVVISLVSYVASSIEETRNELCNSRSRSGRLCADALSAANASLCIGDLEALKDQSRTTCNICTLVLEEQGDWDVPAWQDANIVALALLLSSFLAELDDSTSVTVKDVGSTAMQLFNLAVCTLCSVSRPPAWMPCVRDLLCRAEASVSAAWPGRPVSDISPGTSWEIPRELPVDRCTPVCCSLKHPLSEVHCQDLSRVSFYNEFLRPGEPVLIRGHLAAECWGALEYFANLRALHTDLGGRLVPVNLGSPLVGHKGVHQWPLRRLIEEHLLPSNASHGTPPLAEGPPDEETRCEVAYMSQHHLLHQHADLQDLLAVPPYTLSDNLSPPNVWIGTRGTVTSVHSDPDNNFLCQVAGFKYVRLYGLDQASILHATMLRAKNTNSFGTSPVRVEAPLPPEHADSAGARFMEAVLAPGDMLFIPKSVWHYVRSLSTSVSVNFWF